MIDRSPRLRVNAFNAATVAGHNAVQSLSGLDGSVPETFDATGRGWLFIAQSCPALPSSPPADRTGRLVQPVFHLHSQIYGHCVLPFFTHPTPHDR